jgi:peptidyl-prolyl cis-trans isomerase D
MLQTIRDKITGGFAAVFLGAIGVVFVFWGIDFQSQADTFAAEVNGEVIQMDTVRRAWQQQQQMLLQFMRDVPEDLIKSQQRSLMDGYVRKKLLTQRARELGYSVTDAELLRKLGEEPAFQDNGKFSVARYKQILQQNNLLESQYEADVKNDLLAEQIQNTVLETSFIAPYELERRFALEKQQRELDYVLVAASSFNDQVEVTDQLVQKYYAGHKSEFEIPETVDLEYLELTRAAAQANVNVTEAALKEYYEQVKDRFTSSERRRGRQILLTLEEGADEAAVKKQAEALLAKAKAPGADFAKLAKENSTDPGTAETGGEVDWQTRDGSVPEFSEAFFSMTQDEIRGPVKTQFGFHIIKLEAVDAGAIRSFEDVRAELEPEFRRERSDAAFYEETQQMADKAFKALTELSSVAQELKLEVRKVTGVTRQSAGALGNEPAILEAAFTEDVLERGQNSQLVAIGEDRALVLRVAARTPASVKPLAEVRAGIEGKVRSEQARAAAAKRGAEVLAKLKQGAGWSGIAAEFNLSPAGKRWVTRDDAIAPPKVLKAAFEAPVQVSEASPSYGSTSTDDGSFAVFGVSQTKPGDPSTESEQQRAARRDEVSRSLGNFEFGAYYSEAKANAKIRRNDEKVFE